MWHGSSRTASAGKGSRLARAAWSRAPCRASEKAVGWAGVGAGGCGRELGGAGATSWASLEELDELEELEESELLSRGWSGPAATGAGANGASMPRSREEAASAPRKHCRRASCADAGMYPPGRVRRCHAHTKCTTVEDGRRAASCARDCERFASAGGGARPSAVAHCCRASNARTRESGWTGPACCSR